MAMVCSRSQSVGDHHDDPVALYPLLDMANCPDSRQANASHYNLPHPGSAQERACRYSWYQQAGVTEQEDLDEDRLVFQALADVPSGAEVFESCYDGKSDLELLFYFGFIPSTSASSEGGSSTLNVINGDNSGGVALPDNLCNEA